MKIIIVLFTCFLISTPSLVQAEDELVKFAKSLSAKIYDANLPSIPIEQWLSSALPSNFVAKWGTNITACGEQTGDPSIDKERDMPLCAEISIEKNGKSKGYLLLFVGTQKKGKLKEGATIYYGFFKQDNKTIYIKKLSDIKKLKNI